MLGQIKMQNDGRILDKVEASIERLKAFCPEEGYYVAFSGGKDSMCIYHLCKIAGVKFDAHYNVTSVDPPPLVRFIKQRYPDVIFEYPRDRDGKVVTMWNLIPRKQMPPTRLARYCCEYFKEQSGQGRIVVTGVRWAESTNRKQNQGIVNFQGKTKHTQKIATDHGLGYKVNKSGGVVLNDDNDEARRMVEHCYRTQRTMVNPIVDWDDEDVWEFIRSNNLEYCELYDQGHTRLGCIGCPMGRNRKQELEEYPKYKQMYLRAFDRMIQRAKEEGRAPFRETAQDVFDWWIQEKKSVAGADGA